MLNLLRSAVYSSGFSAGIYNLISNVEVLKSSAVVRLSFSTRCSVDLKFCMQFFGWMDVSDAVTLVTVVIVIRDICVSV